MASVADVPTLSKLVDVWQSAGMIVRRPIDTGSLLDLADARGEFVRALGRSAVWPSTRTITTQGEAGEWLRAHRIDTQWTRDWLVRCIGHLEFGPAIDEILFKYDVLPIPDVAEFLLAIPEFRCQALGFHWQGDEPAPNPIAETREQFLIRMSAAWDRRIEAFGGQRRKTKRNMAEHASWFVKSRVEQKNALEILGEYENPPADESTVRRGLIAFAELIEL